MTLPKNGQISLGDMATEYNQTKSNVRLSDYYYGGSVLEKNDCTDKVIEYKHNKSGYTSHFKNIPNQPSGSPAAGTDEIKMSIFRGKSYYFARQNTISVSGSDVSVNTSNIENNETPSNKRNSENSVYFVVQTSGDCQASSVSNRGLTISQSGRTHSACYLINSKKIRGKGGKGGHGADQKKDGQDGGVALRIRPNGYINNSGGRITGGGGGGGGGNSDKQSYRQCWFCGNTNISAGGGGGGGGKGGGDGGGGGQAPGANFKDNGKSGQSGNNDDGGGGGSGGQGGRANERGGRARAQDGGNGGGWGSSGQQNGGSGGKAFQYQSGKIHTFTNSGTKSGGDQAI